MNPENILWPDGQENMGSLRRLAYYARLSDIDSLPAVPDLDDATSFADAVTLDGNITFNSGAGWHKFYCTQDTGMLEDTIVGERDGKSYHSKIKLFHPGKRSELLGWQRVFANTDMVWLVQDAEGQYRVIGSDAFPAEVETAVNSIPETAEGRSGLTVEIGCASRGPAPIYSGVITLAPDSGSGSV